MPQLDISTYTSQFFWLIVSFSTMFFIMSKFIVPKINEIMNQRQRKIDDYLSAAHEFKMQAEAVIDKYEEALEKANEKAEASMAKAQENMKNFVEQAQSDADERIAIKLKDGEKQISGIQQNALDKIESISADLALEIINKIGLSSISKEDIISVIKQGSEND